MAHFVELALFDILRAPWVSNGNPRMYSVVLPLGPRSAPRYTEFRHDAIIFLFTNFGARGQCSYPNGPFVSLLLSGPILYQLCRVIWLATSPRTPLHSASFWFASMTLATLRMPGGSGPHIRQGGVIRALLSPNGAIWLESTHYRSDSSNIAQHRTRSRMKARSHESSFPASWLAFYRNEGTWLLRGK